MGLTKKQKEQLKKTIKTLSLKEAAEKLGIEPKQAKTYLLKIWGKEKYQKIVEKTEQKKDGGWLIAHWRALAFLAFLVLAVYLNSLGNDFVSDDIATIKDNPLIDQFSYLTSSRFNLRSTIIFFTHKLFGLNPAFFRLSNILFHLGSVWLIYYLLGFFFATPIPLFTAGVFAVHPILTEGVSWISGGPYSNSAFFILLSLASYLVWKNNLKKQFYLASLFSFIIALLFSEKVFWFPAVILLYEILLGNLKTTWPKVLLYFAVSGLWLFSLMGPVGSRIVSLETSYYQEPGTDNLLIKIPTAITSYLGLIFWPKNLAFYHSELNFGQAEYLLRLGGFWLFLALIGYFYKKDRRLFFWLSFFLITLSPTLTPLRIAWTVAERYVYLGALGVFVLIGLGIQKIGEIAKNQKIAYLIFALIILCLSTRTIIRNLDWRNQDTLWLATAKTSPSSSQNHNNLGDLYGRRGEYEKAVEEFKIAIKLKPNYADAYHNLANTYYQMGKDDLALENYQKALEFNPNLWQSHQNLAAIYFNQGKGQQAKEELEKAIVIDSQNVNLYINLAIVYRKLGEKEKASQALQQTLTLDPQNQKAKQLLLSPE